MRIPLKIVVIALCFTILTIVLCAGTLVVWSASQPTPTAVPTGIPTVGASPAPMPESGIIKTKYGYYITYPPLGPVTIQNVHMEPLETPVPGLPIDNQQFSHYPRNTILIWSPITDATGYKLEMEIGDYDDASGLIQWQGIQSRIVKDARYTFTICGPLQCRWRVTALDNSGMYAPSEPSGWQRLSYTL